MRGVFARAAPRPRQHWPTVPGTGENGNGRRGSISMLLPGTPQFPSYGCNSERRFRRPGKARKRSSPIAEPGRFGRTRGKDGITGEVRAELRQMEGQLWEEPNNAPIRNTPGP